MRRMMVLLVALGLLFSTFTMATAFDQNSVSLNASGPNGPAPNSGDGVPDGSGNDAPYGPNSGK